MDTSSAGPGEGYRPGECNVGEAEFAARRRFALLATIVTLGREALLLGTGAPGRVRALVGLPVAGATIAIQQVRRRFCVAFGSRGVYNVSRPLGQVSPVTDAAAAAADRRRVRTIVLEGAVVGALSALAASRLH